MISAFGVDHGEEVSKIALRRVWHGTSLKAAKQIARGGFKNYEGDQGAGFYAGHKDLASGYANIRAAKKGRKKGKSALVPVYVSHPGNARMQGLDPKMKSRGSVWDKKDAIDVGTPEVGDWKRYK